ncbi:hypothetical protein NDU88_000674 [Pleurodeles waltl]|uniref:Uncharacterized protein n=1 Tax=Pleurodeles waltl TaxID=8319 RepID=A0AAV7VZ76_PLEWA|nr:hypothetical protein NDU88_000674 [Pleurodeles waltl]
MACGGAADPEKRRKGDPLATSEIQVGGGMRASARARDMRLSMSYRRETEVEIKNETEPELKAESEHKLEPDSELQSELENEMVTKLEAKTELASMTHL